MTHICVSKLTIIGSYNGLAPGRRQTIIWTNDGILLKGPLGKKLQWNFNRNSNIFIHENALENVVCEKRRPFCLGLGVLTSTHPKKSHLPYITTYQTDCYYPLQGYTPRASPEYLKGCYMQLACGKAANSALCLPATGVVVSTTR